MLTTACASFEQADAEVDERISTIRIRWNQISLQLIFVKDIWDALDGEHQALQEQTFQKLSTKLSDINAKIGRICRKESGQIVGVKRWKYVFCKQRLDKAIDDLISWQDMYNLSWYLIFKTSKPIIDQELTKGDFRTFLPPFTKSLRDLQRKEPSNRRSVFLPRDGLDFAQRHKIRFSTAELIKRFDSDKWVVVDRVQVSQPYNLTLMMKDMRELARKLSAIDPEVSCILSCRGIIRNDDFNTGRPSSFDFIFDVPENLGGKPETLRGYFCFHPQPALNERFQLAYHLAKSVCYVHTLGFVHKNIRPETFIGWSTETQSFASVFLVGFEKLRSADGRTIKIGDSILERNIYRHPQRQGLHPDEVYEMQHDMYSLGVCLLEIGIWQSFLVYNNADEPKASAHFQEMLDKTNNVPIALKDSLIALAREKLPQQMGPRYTEVTVNCLTCLDEDNADFGDKAQFEDGDGIIVGARYIEKVRD